MTFGLRCSGPACRPHPASLPVRVPTVESLPPASFGFPLAVAPCGLATVAVIGPDWLLSSNKTLPMLGTPCCVPTHGDALGSTLNDTRRACRVPAGALASPRLLRQPYLDRHRGVHRHDTGLHGCGHRGAGAGGSHADRRV